ncbi:hypothetical protein C4565_00525 [Candidatus Parcubacteria bacterium]|nr:MAG: hypothetical protein C4565_00525 [Candidatus Parcubacteria bacterium]
MPVAKKWSGPNIVDLTVNMMDHRLYENQPRVGTQHSPLKGQVILVKQLSRQEQLLRMRVQGCGIKFS